MRSVELSFSPRVPPSRGRRDEDRPQRRSREPHLADSISGAEVGLGLVLHDCCRKNCLRMWMGGRGSEARGRAESSLRLDEPSAEADRANASPAEHDGSRFDSDRRRALDSDGSLRAARQERVGREIQ